MITCVDGANRTGCSGGGSLGDALTAGARGGFWGAVSGAAAGYIGGQDWKRWAQALAHGVSQGAVQDLRGEGSFASGFYSAAMAKYMGQFSLGNPYADLTYLAVVGGTASEVGGGKFANGAVTAVFVKLLNDDQHEDPGNREDQGGRALRDGDQIGEVFEVSESAEFVTDENGNKVLRYDAKWKAEHYNKHAKGDIPRTRIRDHHLTVDFAVDADDNILWTDYKLSYGLMGDTIFGDSISIGVPPIPVSFTEKWMVTAGAPANGPSSHFVISLVSEVRWNIGIPLVRFGLSTGNGWKTKPNVVHWGPRTVDY